MECLIVRDGDSYVNLHGFQYVFKLDRETRKSLGQVFSEEHRNYLISTGNFRLFDKDKYDERKTEKKTVIRKRKKDIVSPPEEQASEDNEETDS
jgi:hypothetical protein